MQLISLTKRHLEELTAHYALEVVYGKDNKLLVLLLVLLANPFSFSDVLVIIVV